jgi:hypothetical protein
MTNQGSDNIKGILFRFVYQSTFQDYFELMEDWEVEENTNINVLEEIEENHLRPFEYAKAQIDVLDEVP